MKIGVCWECLQEIFGYDVVGTERIRTEAETALQEAERVYKENLYIALKTFKNTEIKVLRSPATSLTERSKESTNEHSI